MAEYTPLEGDFIQSISGKPIGFSTDKTPSFFDASSFIYAFALTVIIVTASFRYAYAGMLRMQASEEGIKKSKEEFKRVTYGLLGVLGLWLILATVNKDMLTGDVTLSNLRAEQTGTGNSSVVITPTTPSNPGTTASCSNVETIKNNLINGKGICDNTSCSLTGCITTSKYIPLIKSIAGNDWKIALVIMCKESGGDEKAKNRNPNGTFDCGLMQVNQAGECDNNALDPQINITRGVTKLREKLSASQNKTLYPVLKVRSETAAFTAYNCCANGTIPNSESSSCKKSDGWPSIPKWACPIDPGEGKFNMCTVKTYACDLTACLNQLN